MVLAAWVAWAGASLVYSHHTRQPASEEAPPQSVNRSEYVFVCSLSSTTTEERPGVSAAASNLNVWKLTTTRGEEVIYVQRFGEFCQVHEVK